MLHRLMPPRVHRLRGGAAVLEGSGGNVALEAIKALRPTPAWDAGWSEWVINPAPFTKPVDDCV